MQGLRFNLRALFVFVAVVAAFLGYAQWRRQNIMREARILESQGFTLLWEEHWADAVWPRVPNRAKFEYEKMAAGHWRIGSHVYAEHEIGADEVQLVVALIYINAVRVEHRPHRAVENKHAVIG